VPLAASSAIAVVASSRIARLTSALLSEEGPSSSGRFA
jgi:hypothetical protein